MASQELEAVLEMLKARPDRTGMSWQQQRAEFENAPRFPVPEDVQSTAVDAAGIPAEWITTPQAAPQRVIYYLHGGGYVLGSINTHRELISRLSRATGARALAINYRLAPEDPFPAAVEDAVTAYRWLLSRGVDPARMAIAGDSAGGGLVVAAMVALRDAGEPLPAAGVSISPWADLDYSGEAAAEKPRDILTQLREILRPMAQVYLAGADPQTPLASPVYADLKGLPPLLIQVGTAEELLDEATRLAERARADGVDVTLEPWEEMVHVWHNYASILPEGQQAIERIADFVRKHTG